MHDVACLGKVPTHGEFLRVRTSSPTMRSLDQWIRKGLYHARRNRPPDWEEAYDDGPIRRFLFWGQGPSRPNVLLGILCPSRDRSGRMYPFLVTCEVPTRRLRAEHAAYLPLHAAPFFDAAEQLGQKAVAGEILPNEVTERISTFSRIGVSSPVPREHKRYLQRETAGSFLEALFGHFDDSRKYRFFANLFEAVQQFNGASSSPEHGLQFPMSDAGEGTGTVVSFWADLVWRLIGDGTRAPTFFWTDGGAEDASGGMLLYADVPGPPALMDVLSPDRAQGRILCLQEAGRRSAAEAALAIPEAYGELLEEEDVRLWDFLRHF